MDENVTNAALLRMRRAFEGGKGVRLSWEELRAFNVETLGDWWNSIDDDGRNTRHDDRLKTPLS